MIETVVQRLRHHKITSAEDYLRVATKQIAKLQQAGYDVAIHEDPTTCHAYINYGRWIIDCACGAGNAVDPAFAFAVCVACGAIHRDIRYPADRAAIEATLSDRARAVNRNWEPTEIAHARGRERGDTLASLQAENAAHGVRGPR